MKKLRPEVASILQPMLSEVRNLDVITDPKCIDSAVFFHIFDQHDIECRLVSGDWKGVPKMVNSSRHAIGF